MSILLMRRRAQPLSPNEGNLVFYDKLVGDGVAYINTEYYPNGLDSFAWDAEPPKYVNKFVFGCKSTKLNIGALVYYADESYYLVGPTAAKLIYEDNTTRMTRQMAVVSVDGAYKRNLFNGNVKVELSPVGSYVSAVSTTPLLVYACQKSATDTSADRIYSGAIRSFSITDIDGNIVMSLKPCVWNGEAGMWDEVSGKFFGNSATKGKFDVAND